MSPKALDPSKLGGTYQEVKEAFCDALVNLTVTKVSGHGAVGAEVLGSLPQRTFVSGFLLPRYDHAGNDETSDINLALLGIDFQAKAGSTGEVEALPGFSLYLRVLPTWEDLSKRGLMPEFTLSNEWRRQIKDEINALVTERFKDVPILKDGNGTKEERTKQARLRREIRQAASHEIHVRHGLVLSAKGAGGDGDDRGEAVPEEVVKEVPEGPAGIGGADDNGGALATVTFKKIPGHMAAAQEIPLKWRRLTPQLQKLVLPFGLSAAERAQRLEEYNAALRGAVLATVTAWLESEEGRLDAWRKVDVSPRHVENAEAWNAFLEEVRKEPVVLKSLFDSAGGLKLAVETMPDYLDPGRANWRVLLENANQGQGPRSTTHRCPAIFQVTFSVSIPTQAHLPLHLDRVEPSYRFRHFMTYPAIGLNCGVVAETAEERLNLTTTWAPRFVQPRIIATVLDVETRFSRLSHEAADPAALRPLVTEYAKWIESQERTLKDEVEVGLGPEEALRECKRFADDLAAWRRELGLVERGIDLLMLSRNSLLRAAKATGAEKADLERLAAPWRAWLLMNRTFAVRDAKRPDAGWRLFQLAFVLAHLPCLASRMREFADWHAPELDEEYASLLFFPTGGGKSEAFYGTLVFAMFLDRLRGKDRGVTGLIRYPLRLLTLQQAQRFLKLLVHAELVRLKGSPEGRELGSWPFEIGFWVGSANTPNWASAAPAAVPTAEDAKHVDDGAMVLDREADQAEYRRIEQYLVIKHSYNKIPVCPVCGQKTGLRRYPPGVLGDDLRLGVVCFNKRCDWNIVHQGPVPAPLPFLFTDDTIYQRAPSVILGTIDKLAMLGQSPGTIANVHGMFGTARWIGPKGHLTSPRSGDDLRVGPEAQGRVGVYPSYQDGRQVFHDPFPSLVIQDEAHLLEDSLGTFSALFETNLEAVFKAIDLLFGDKLDVARCWSVECAPPRMPKVIAATATVSNPEKQLEVLYQRKPLHFPHPGPDIYHSFYSNPAPPPDDNDERLTLSMQPPLPLRPEQTAPWMRLYVSLMTNGASHTVTTVSVLSAFHLALAELWDLMSEPETRQQAFDRLKAAVSPGQDGEWRRRALDHLTDADVALTLLDLHRISLTYVTNKKGGDQVIDALDGMVRRDHEAAGREIEDFKGRLISGGVDMGEIQEIMGEAESGVTLGAEFPKIDTLLRNIVATSAISHGVDVDRFNSMFFAGLPSDIAEYIQASSRVGRSHVGFVLLVPTPQSRRDRYVVETHDIFHRFLERMISSPAVERWAENALVRVTASVAQSWAMLEEARRFTDLPDARKHEVRPLDIVANLAVEARDKLGFTKRLGGYMLGTTGFHGRGSGALGEPFHKEHYSRVIDNLLEGLANGLLAADSEASLRFFWGQATSIKPPMTSLRDVDEAAWIEAAHKNLAARSDHRFVNEAQFKTVMDVVRRQRALISETDGDSSGGNHE